MDVFEAIKRRRSIRSYQKKEVEQDKLLQLLEGACLAPSASNRQEWRFVVVRDKQTKKALCKAAKDQKFVDEAPVIIACCAQTDDHVMTCGQACYPIDVAIAIDHVTLLAQELGLGTCWIGAFYEDEVKKILDIPGSIKVVELLAVGYASGEPSLEKKRLPLRDIAFLEQWGSPLWTEDLMGS